MKITLEMIDELRKRKDITYNKAKDALEQTEGNLVEAMILLEKSTTSQTRENKSQNVIDKIKNYFNKLKNINITFSTNNEVVLKITSLLVIILSMILLTFLIVGLITNINNFIPFFNLILIFY